MKLIIRSRAFVLAASILAGYSIPAAASELVRFTNILSFSGTNGANPDAELVQEQDGTIYGTTASGGTNGQGCIFRYGGTNNGLSVAHSFTSADGASPLGRLVVGTDGDLYGTTSGGGSNGYGTVFRMGTNGSFASLLSFNDTNGAQPRAGLSAAPDGSFYGTAATGGTNGGGTAFRVSTNGALATLASFDVTAFEPYSPLLQSANGDLYGTTYLGGTSGNGTVFRLPTNGSLSLLYSFTNGADGANPYAGLVQGPDGGFYGTAFYGGSAGQGTVFELAADGMFVPLVSFNGTNGAHPQGPLLLASDGYFYGTTQNGGAYTNQFGTGYGTVFQLDTNGLLTTVVSFNGTNGAFPRAGLMQASDGSLYGTTTYGGSSDNGTIFKLTIIPAPVFQNISAEGNGITLTWSSVAGQTYQVVYAANLNQPTWNTVGPSVLATSSSTTTLDVPGSDQSRFYRIELLP